MSASKKAEILAIFTRFPLYSSQQWMMWINCAAMSVTCQTRTHAPQQIAALFDHIVGAGE